MKRNQTIKANTVVYKCDGTRETGSGEILHEHTVDVYVNGLLTFRMVCIPEYLTELVAGRLITEGIVGSAEEIEKIEGVNSPEETELITNEKEAENSCIPVIDKAIHVRISPKSARLLQEGVAPDSTASTANKSFFKIKAEEEETDRVVPDPANIIPEHIFAMIRAFREDSALHRSTQGTHSCYLGTGGKVIFSAEDIGRHNALDKAIGYAALQGYRPEECMVFTTGRVPSDMVRKVIAARIPVLISKGVPTWESVRLAKANHIRLICKAWPDQFEVFS